MNILVLLGSPRKKDSYNVCKMIENKMKKKGSVTFEYIQLSTLNIKECKGCNLCLQKGEEYCSIKDDIIELRDKMIKADGIIFASPVYACHITSSFKKVIDRLAYLFHRPKLIGKPAINIITTGGGARKVTGKYLKMTACGWGFNLVGTISIISPMFFEDNNMYSSKYYNKINKYTDKLVEEFYDKINNYELPKPSFYDIYMFNGLRSKTYMSEVDYNYWENKGWLNSNYYYKTKINIFKKTFGKILSYMIKQAFNKMQNSGTTR
jgi:multimeric flavodoxin WrbA